MLIKKHCQLATFGVAICSLSACDSEGVESGFSAEEGIDKRDLDFDVDCAPFAAQVNALNFEKVGIIRSLDVVDDPCRTVFDANIWAVNNCSVTTKGRWSFWYLMSQAAGNRNVSEFILKTLESFENQPVVNTFQLTKRAGIRTMVINPWRIKSNCLPDKKWDEDKCNLLPEHAPFRLLAIVNRMDLRPGADDLQSGYNSSNDKDQAGEGRFVFGFVDTQGSPLAATMIVEYKLPTSVNRTRAIWANQWISLNSKLPGNGIGQFNQSLQTITDGFVSKNVFLGKPNFGSALSTVRTDEKAFGTKWSLREFKFGCTGICDINNRLLVPSPVNMTPDNKFENLQPLYDFLNANGEAIRNGQHDVPLTWQGIPFLAGESISNPIVNNSIQWGKDLSKFSDIQTNNFDTRRKFALPTCNGCHYFETNNGLNQHIINRKKGFMSTVSGFIDPSQQPWDVPGLFEDLNVDPELPHQFNEPRRRMCELVNTATGEGNLLSNFFGG